MLRKDTILYLEIAHVVDLSDEWTFGLRLIQHIFASVTILKLQFHKVLRMQEC